MKKVIVALSCVIMMFLLSACGGSPVASVNGEEISQDDYTAYIDNLMIIYELNGYTLTNDDKVSLKDTVIKEMVNQEVVRRSAEELGCYPTEKEIEAYFDEQLAASFGDAKTGKTYIKEQGLDLDVYRASYEVALCQEKIGENEVPKNSMTEKDAVALYEETPDDYYTRTVSHILITPDPGDRKTESDEDGNVIYTDEEWAAAKTKAEDLIKQLDDGADFAELAKKNSDDTASAANGGAVGEAFTREGSQYVEEFTAASFDLTKEGTYTETPIRSSYGYHIIKATGVVTEADKDAIIQGILDDNLTKEREEAATAYTEDFQNDADIEYFALSDKAQAEIDAAKEPAKTETGDGANADAKTTDDGTTDAADDTAK